MIASLWVVATLVRASLTEDVLDENEVEEEVLEEREEEGEEEKEESDVFRELLSKHSVWLGM